MTILIRMLLRWLRGRRQQDPALTPEPAVVAPGATAAAFAAVASAPGAAPRARRSAASYGPVAIAAHQARYDLLTSWRDPRARFFTVVFPLLLLVIFIGVFGNNTTVVDGVTVRLARFYVPGILTVATITASYAGLAISITSARENGIFKRRRATPLPASALVVGQAFATLTTVVFMTTVLLVIARLGYSVGISFGAVVATFLAVVIGTITFSCIAYAVSDFIGTPEAAQPIVQLSVFPLYFISGVWIPTQHFSSALRTISEIFPIEHLAAALHLASVRNSLGTAIAGKDLFVLGIWAVGSAAIAAWRFNWMPKGSGS